MASKLAALVFVLAATCCSISNEHRVHAQSHQGTSETYTVSNNGAADKASTDYTALSNNVACRYSASETHADADASVITEYSCERPNYELCSRIVTHQPRSNKRWFSRACVRDTSATATISGQTANVWGYTSLWDPLHDHAIPQLLEFAVITREDAKAGDYYCPVPDDNSGICEGTTFCNKNFECDPAPTDPSHKECTMREWGSIIDDSPKSPYSRFLASPHAKSAKIFTSPKLTTTEDVCWKRCIDIFTVGLPPSNPVPDPNPSGPITFPKMAEWGNLEAGQSYCIRRGEGQACHPQLPHACAKGLYCKDGTCTEEPIAECFDNVQCMHRGTPCGYPPESFLGGGSLDGTKKVCCRTTAMHYEPLDASKGIVPHGNIEHDPGIPVCGDGARARCAGTVRADRCVPVLKGAGERCLSDSDCFTTCGKDSAAGPSSCSLPGLHDTKEKCDLVKDCTWDGSRCIEHTCDTTQYKPLDPLPPLVNCKHSCRKWRSISHGRYGPPGYEQLFTTMGDICVDDDWPTYKGDAAMPKDWPCFPQGPKTNLPLDEWDRTEHRANNQGGVCAGELKCAPVYNRVLVNQQHDKDKARSKLIYEGFGCCYDGRQPHLVLNGMPNFADEAPSPECLAHTKEEWFAWRSVTETSPHYAYKCEDSKSAGYWYLYSEPEHKELVECYAPMGVTKYGDENWCLLPRFWPCLKDHQCQSGVCLNTDKPMAKVRRYGEIFQCA